MMFGGRGEIIETGRGPIGEDSVIWRERQVATIFASLGCLYLPVTKAANTSIKTALIRADRIAEGNASDPEEDINPHAFDAAHVVPWDAAYDFTGPRFTFVRNPFARLFSCYRDKILPEPQTRGTYINGVHAGLRRYKRMRAGMSFGEFARVISRIPDRAAEIHFVSQRAFLVGPKGLRVDFVGRVERKAEHWPLVERIVGRSIPLPSLNVTGTGREHAYREHYDGATRKLVERRYAADLALLGYSF